MERRGWVIVVERGPTGLHREEPAISAEGGSLRAWGFPFTASNLANTPGAKTLIDNGFAGRVLGATGYLFVNDMWYLEGGAYGTLQGGI
jgi:hypothetical protein